MRRTSASGVCNKCSFRLQVIISGVVSCRSNEIRKQRVMEMRLNPYLVVEIVMYFLSALYEILNLYYVNTAEDPTSVIAEK
jgi:hypothetical protein